MKIVIVQEGVEEIELWNSSEQELGIKASEEFNNSGWQKSELLRMVFEDGFIKGMRTMGDQLFNQIGKIK